ncbi:HAD-IC family P-type ATPase, partial [Nocardia wallacei]|uniref:HAD-IC family P-type ATPase n=1 Tax=Nocardia wallacei TaxID=480035 RepID=UPI0024585EB3
PPAPPPFAPPHPPRPRPSGPAPDARGLTLSTATDFDSMPGRGVRATIGAHAVEVGNPSRLLPAAQSSGRVAEVVAAAESAGRTAVVVLLDGAAAGVLTVADRLRPAATGIVPALTELTGTPPILLTGDNPRAARALAEQVGITDIRAGLLPEDKVAAVRELESAGRRVAVVGDGVNDAPALAAAHTGIAMGRTGSDLALDTADAVIVRDDLTTVPAVLTMARRAKRVVVANLAIAATFIAVLVIWDLAGHLPLPLGVAGHEGSTVIVGLNGMRLLATRAWTAAARIGRSGSTSPAAR